MSNYSRFWFVCGEDVYAQPFGRLTYCLQMLTGIVVHGGEKSAYQDNHPAFCFLIADCMYLHVSLISTAVHESYPGSSPNSTVPVL